MPYPQNHVSFACCSALCSDVYAWHQVCVCLHKHIVGPSGLNNPCHSVKFAAEEAAAYTFMVSVMSCWIAIARDVNTGLPSLEMSTSCFSAGLLYVLIRARDTSTESPVQSCVRVTCTSTQSPNRCCYASQRRWLDSCVWPSHILRSATIHALGLVAVN